MLDELEKQLAGLTLNEGGKSPLVVAQEKGTVEMGGQQRKVVTGDRKTDKGKQSAKEAEEKRKKEKALFKATLKKQAKDENDDDEWESDNEEDFPHVKLEELLDNLKLDDGTNTDDDQY